MSSSDRETQLAANIPIFSFAPRSDFVPADMLDDSDDSVSESDSSTRRDGDDGEQMEDEGSGEETVA